MTRKLTFRVLFALIMVVALVAPATVVFAAGPGPDGPWPHEGGPGGGPHYGPGSATGPASPPPIAIVGPRLKPPAISHSDVLDPAFVYNNSLVPPYLPVQSLEADAADAGRTQQEPGRGIRQTSTGIGFGLLLYDVPNVCNNFNVAGTWAAQNSVSDIWTDYYAGWGPFAINNPPLYQAKNVTFSMERSVGPGNRYNDNLSADGKEEASAKIASNQPYAAGFGSPRIPVPDGYGWGKVQVTVDYLIWDHDSGGKQGGPDGWDYDWASLGVKAGAGSPSATYVNGYVRGEWAELSVTIDLGDAPDVMVLIQAQSPGSFNSNIYFDNVRVAFIDKDGNGKYLKDCRYEGSVN